MTNRDYEIMSYDDLMTARTAIKARLMDARYKQAGPGHGYAQAREIARIINKMSDELKHVESVIWNRNIVGRPL